MYADANDGAVATGAAAVGAFDGLCAAASGGADKDNKDETAPPPPLSPVDVDGGEGTGGKKCCSGLRFDGIQEAQGYALLTFARGGIIMSNIFLSSAFIHLAKVSAGCDPDSDDDEEEEGEGDECDAKVYGFRPSSLITMIAVVSGILSAFLLPVIGAIVDYTPHRRLVGVASAIFVTIVQAVQMYLTDRSWFPMAVLQAINGFMYMVQVLAVYAYLPDVGREVGPGRMTTFSALFTMCQFGAQCTYLVLNIGVGIALRAGDVLTAQISQGICVAWLLLTFLPGWRKMPSVPALNERGPEDAGKGLVLLGFVRNWRTMIGIRRYYGRSLGLYLLAVVFAESGANAFTVVSVTFMVEVLGMTGTQVGIVFLVTLVSSLPGSKLGELVSKRTCPVTSWKINIASFIAITAVGSFVLTSPERQLVCYFFGVLWGLMLGWFYPLENVIFTMGIPKGQESELAGFYTYCRSILTWLPPLIFTVMNESGIEMRWGLLSLVIFLFIGLVFLQMMMPWDEICENPRKANRMTVIEEGSGKD